jgi:TFIIF-interacting CTD phosphatase-like protein
MDEIQILFPEVKIKEFIIKPWTFGILFQVADLLGNVIDKAEKRNLIEELNNSSGIIPYTTFVKLFSICGEEILTIISITLNISQEEVRSLTMEDGLNIAFTIYNQNKTTIVNSIKNLISSALIQEEESGAKK